MRRRHANEVGQLSARGLHVVCVRVCMGHLRAFAALTTASDTCTAARVYAVKHDIYLVCLSHLANASGFYEVR